MTERLSCEIKNEKRLSKLFVVNSCVIFCVMFFAVMHNSKSTFFIEFRSFVVSKRLEIYNIVDAQIYYQRI